MAQLKVFSAFQSIRMSSKRFCDCPPLSGVCEHLIDYWRKNPPKDRIFERYRNSQKEVDELKTLLNKADNIILDIHAQITTFSKYTASKVYEWKDLRGKDAISALKDFDDNGRDE